MNASNYRLAPSLRARCHLRRISTLLLAAAAFFTAHTAYATIPCWDTEGVAYLNFESKDRHPGPGPDMGRKIVGIRFTRVPQMDGTFKYNPIIIGGNPAWLVPPNSMVPVQDRVPPFIGDDSQQELYSNAIPKDKQPAFDINAFNPALARAGAINAVRAQVDTRLIHVWTKVELLFDPMTFKHNEAAVTRGDFEWIPLGADWVLAPVAVAGRDRVWNVDIGGSSFALLGVATSRGMRLFTQHGEANVFSDSIAGAPPYGAVGVVSNAVSHTTLHEIGHMLGCNAPIPGGLPGVSGHSSCPCPIPSPWNIMLQGGDLNLVMRKAPVRPYLPDDLATMIVQVGPRAWLVRTYFNILKTIIKDTGDARGMGVHDENLRRLIGILCAYRGDGGFLTDSLRQNASDELFDLIGLNTITGGDATLAINAGFAMIQELARGGVLEEDIPRRPADINADLIVDAEDLALLIGNWGNNPVEFADLDGDGATGSSDLAILIGSWGPLCN